MLPEHVSHYVTFEQRLSCNYPGCEKKVKSFGLCGKHYMSLYRWHGQNQTPMPKNPQQFIASKSATCTVCGVKAVRRGFCGKHYSAWYKRASGRLKKHDVIPGFNLPKKHAELVVTSEKFPVADVVPDDYWDFVKKELGI